MNILFNTQSIGVHVFWKLFQQMKNDQNLEVGHTGFFVTNRDEYDRFLQVVPEFRDQAGIVVAEWDILDEARSLQEVDLSLIEKWEKKIGDATLWNAIICDRRFNYPVRAQFVQDYQPSYDHVALLKIVQCALQRIDKHLSQVNPDAVVGLNAVTLYDYLYYLMAENRGIPYFQLKLTRVENYVSLFTNPLGISPHIGDRISHYLENPTALDDNPDLQNEVQQFLDRSRGESLSYEGAISKKGAEEKGKVVSKNSGASTVTRQSTLKRIFTMLLGNHKDAHYPSQWQAQWYTRLLKPLRKSLIHRSVFNEENAAWQERLKGYRYAVYPMNTEPEVALLVYGRAFRNQIETVRNIAASLPVGWKLVVKEHPNSMGYRSQGYYRKLREIPNVELLGPTVDTNEVVAGSDLVFVVFGTIGLEAVMKEKPVITFCETPYGSFPDYMVRFVDNLSILSSEIRDLLDCYRFDEGALKNYLAAHIEGSVRVNLFTGLLGKGRRTVTGDTIALDDQYRALARYTFDRISEEKSRSR